MSEYSEGVLCWPDVSAELLLHTWLLLIFEQARSRVRMSLCGESSASLTSWVGVMRLWLDSVVLQPHQRAADGRRSALLVWQVFIFPWRFDPVCDFHARVVKLTHWSGRRGRFVSVWTGARDEKPTAGELCQSNIWFTSLLTGYSSMHHVYLPARPQNQPAATCHWQKSHCGQSVSVRCCRILQDLDV